MNIKKEVAAIKDEMIGLRRDFHAHPEIGLNEHRTAGIIEDLLKGYGYDVRRCAGTGVIGVLRGGCAKEDGRTLLMRCDIDALPVCEETGLAFASENEGVMHACGHDAHMAIHLATAKILAANAGEIPGTVVMLFQTNEEDAGAELMIEDGAMTDPEPDNVCGFHIWSPIPTGKVGIVQGPIMASSWYFKLAIHGKGGHGGAPHTAINPIDAGAKVLDGIKQFLATGIDAKKLTAISVCEFHAGDNCIIVPETAVLEGSVRCLHEDDEEVRKQLKDMCEGICASYGCTCEMEFICGNTLLDNDPGMADLARDAAAEILGEENILGDEVRTMIGDDFAEFSRRKPGNYYFLGTRSEAAGSVYEHHNAHFTVDEDSLEIGARIQLNIVKKYFGF